MNQPTSMTRFLGTPRVSAALYVVCAVCVLGWLGGEVPWWLGLVALCFVGTVRKAVKDVRRYNQWARAWAAMGNAPPIARSAAVPGSTVRKRKTSSSRAAVIVAVLSLVIIPMVMHGMRADDALSTWLALLWLGMAGYLVFRLATLRRAPSPAAGTVSAGERKNSAPADVVEWVLPRASSSPSRIDAMRRLPEYSARLMA